MTSIVKIWNYCKLLLLGFTKLIRKRFSKERCYSKEHEHIEASLVNFGLINITLDDIINAESNKIGF
jgi:hypothetical protein